MEASRHGSPYLGALRSLWELRGRGHTDLEPATESNLVYRTGEVRRLAVAPRMDVYLPAPSQRSGASVVLVHGGGFVLGSKTVKPMRFLATRLVRAGIAVAVPDYRMIFRGGRFDECVTDVVDAVQFWEGRLGAFGLSPRQLSIAGLSAGATLAYVAASLVGSGVDRLVCAFGPYAVDHLRGPVQRFLPRMLFRTAERAAWAAQLPLGRTRHAEQATLLLHGTEDALVPFDQAHRLLAKRQAIGLPTELAVFEGAPHGFFARPSAHAEEGVRRVLEFLR